MFVKWMRSGIAFVLLSLCLSVPTLAEQRANGIEIAIAPFLPVHTMVQNYEPMRGYLERRLQRPVLFITAPDYRIFNDRTRSREYAFIVTVVNAAYLAHVDSGYIPLLRPTVYTKPALVVRKDAALGSIGELRGKVIALPSPMAVVAMMAPAMLHEAGLDPQRDVMLRYLDTHATAVNYVISGEAAAAIVSDVALQQMPSSSRDAVTIVRTWDRGAMPGVVYLASPKLARGEAELIQKAILDFVREPEGQALMRRLGYGTLVPAKWDDLKPFAPYATALRELLEPAGKKQ